MTPLYKLTVSEASAQIAEGGLSPVSLAEALLERIDRLEPSLEAWVTIDKNAVMEAAVQLDQELKAKGPRSPLHGIPVGIKDIYYTAGMKTTACSKVYADFVPTYDATSVSRLKDAGAIVLGKTVTTEFAHNEPPPTVSPWNASHTPGGSSSGSAVAVAARMCPAATGSQTGGSILRPSSYAGIVGLKPTFGRVSMYGIAALSWSMDTIGPMVNCVEDAALMLQVMAGHDPMDPRSSIEPVPDYRQALEQMDKPPRIGIVRDFFFSNAVPEVQKHTEEVVQLLATAGAQIEEVSLPASFDTALDAHTTVIDVECAAVHEEMFRTRADDFGPRLRETIQVGLLIPASHYVQAQRLRFTYRREMEALAQQCDVLLTPTTHMAAPGDLSTTGNPWFQSPWTTCGLPTITIPSGLSPSVGLPLGIQLAASSFAEGRLLAVARWCEQILDVHLVPPEAQQ